MNWALFLIGLALGFALGFLFARACIQQELRKGSLRVSSGS
jgi:uncharacterized membrane-anchored protein YhcB (DUF1043 family)